jgi:predicted transcriptional regulator
MSKKLITEVEDGLYEAVQAQAKDEERSQAQIVRRALRRYLGWESPEAQR